jgi:predicted ATPase
MGTADRDGRHLHEPTSRPPGAYARSDSRRVDVALSDAAEDRIIRTPDQRLRVFISSTLAELAPERAAVRAAIEQLHLTPVMFELGARPHAPRSLYRAYLAQSHVFLGIYWQRYGWIAPDEEVSGLEDEYLRADRIPQLLYVKEPAPEREPRLEELIGRLEADDRASYRRFATAEELAGLVRDDLVVLLTERFERTTTAAATDRAGPPLPRRSTPPRPLTVTVGRDDAIEHVGDLVVHDRTRLVTLTGPGGVGKSRLALEVAHRVAAAFPDGVHLVPLEPVNEPEDVLSVVADRLDVGGEGARPIAELLAERLRDRQLLLVLDNFEQVVAAGPRLAELLDRCPHVQALVTSRRPLRLRGEREHPLPPLEVPAPNADGDTAAVELFVQRARAVRPDFVLTPRNRAAVGELVRRLDGLPLAIELAAARIRLLSPSALLEHLAQRIDVLSSGAVDLPERQRTLRTAIDWSYKLLDPAEQQLLDRLSVFARDATIEAVEAVCAEPGDADVLETLSSLLEKSLLVSTVSDDGEPRLQLLNTVRVFAAERLAERGETAAIADRHAAWFLERATLVSLLRDRAAHRRFTPLLAESDDIRSAMDHALERRDVAAAAGFAGPTWMWFWLRGRLPEVRPWFEAAAELVDDPGARDHDRGMLLYTLGQTREIVGDAAGSIEPLTRAIELFEAAGDEITAAAAKIALSAGLPHLGRTAESREHAVAALEVGLRRDEPHLVGYASAMIGTSSAIEGDLTGARTAFERSLQAARRIGFTILEAQASAQLALVDLLEHHPASAWRRLRAMGDLLTASGSCEVASYWLEFAAAALIGEGDPTTAADALAAADELRRDAGVVLWPLLRPYHDRLTAEVAAALTHVADGHAPDREGGERADPWELIAHLGRAHAPGAVAPAERS